MGRFATTVALYEELRPPYPPAFFRSVAQKLGLGKEHALIDLGTQVLLTVIGFVIVLNPSLLVNQVHLGTAPTWSQLIFALSVAMVAYTGIETVSNLAEEARDPRRSIPGSIRLVAVAPGPFPTPGAWSRLMPEERQAADPKRGIPLRRYGEHIELANLCSYLVSDQAGYITGQTLVVFQTLPGAFASCVSPIR